MKFFFENLKNYRHGPILYIFIYIYIYIDIYIYIYIWDSVQLNHPYGTFS